MPADPMRAIFFDEVWRLIDHYQLAKLLPDQTLSLSFDVPATSRQAFFEVASHHREEFPQSHRHRH